MVNFDLIQANTLSNKCIGMFPAAVNFKFLCLSLPESVRLCSTVLHSEELSLTGWNDLELAVAAAMSLK